MKPIKHLITTFAAVALAAVACADVTSKVELLFAPGDTLAYTLDGCERAQIDFDDQQPSPVLFDLGRNGHYVFYSNGVMTATLDVSGLGTAETKPIWAKNTVAFTLDTLAERTFDLTDGVASTNLTYSGTGWDEPGAGTEATIVCEVGGEKTTLASGLVGTGETAWTPTANGTYKLSHISGTATETATITVVNLPMVTVSVGDLAAKHLMGKVVWNGIETVVAGQSFELPKDVKDAKLVLTAENGYRPDDSLGTASPTGDGRWMVEVPLDDLTTEGGTIDIPEAVAYGVRLDGITNRYPWNGKIDVVASVVSLDAEKHYRLVTTLALGGTTKRVSRELGAGQDATYTNTVDCASLFGANVDGEVSVRLALEEVTDVGGETVSASGEGAVAVDARATKEIDGSAGAVTANLTYSGDGWGETVGGSASIALAFEGGAAKPFATGLTGEGTVPWTPVFGGRYAFTHTAGGVTETATFKLVGFPGGEDNPWEIGAGDAATVTAYVKDGYLYLAGAGEVTEFADGAPWGDYEQLGSPLAGAVLPRSVTIPASVLATLPISVKGGEPSGAISPAEFDQVQIVDGKAYLGVSVYTNSEVKVKGEGWGVATNGVIVVPAPGKQGFFYLMSKPAVPSDALPVFDPEIR